MRQASSRERSGELCARRVLSLSSSGLHDRIFRKDRLAAPERLVDRRFRCHPIVYHIVHRDGEHVLGADLRPCRIVHVVRRGRRTVDALPGIGLIIDNKTVVAGSYNFSENAEANDENMLMIVSPQVATAYTNYFDALFRQYEQHGARLPPQ
jgi:hypothetical protein